MAKAGNAVVVVKVTGLADAFRRLASAQRALAGMATIQADLLEAAAQQVDGSEGCPTCGGRGWHTAGGGDPTACGMCPAGERWERGDGET
jgi:hypothetical protein